MEVDRRKNRNCYNCGGFRHLAKNYKNRKIENKIGEGRRLEYRQRERIEGNYGQIDNLKGKENLETLD